MITLQRALLSTLILPAALAAQEPTDSTEEADHPRKEGLHLEPTRSLRFTTTVGSWMSVDVSPDGETIVFDHLGDLYTVPIGGGTATPLTRGMGFDMQPRFSPDGERIVFVSDRTGGWGVWILARDLSDTVRVSSGKNDAYQSPDWTPDGEYIVVSRDAAGPGRLHLYHVEGGDGVSLIDEPGSLRTTGPAVTADGRYIWFAQRTGTFAYNNPMGQWQLGVYDRTTGERFARTNRFGGGIRPTLSPDGRWLVYGSRLINETGLRLRDLRTGEERWLHHPVQRDEQEAAASRDVLPGMSFTPDSRELVAAYDGRIWRIPLGGGQPVDVPIEVPVDLDLGPEVAFAYPIRDTETFVARQIRDAVLSPDGARLAFTVLDRLYVMDYPSGTPRRLTQAELVEHQPIWSPDGRWIGYVTAHSTEGGHVMKVRADGRRDPQQLTTTPAFYRQPAWSPDGSRLVAIRGPARAFRDALQRGVPGGAEDLIWVPSDGGAATVIRPADIIKPHFSDDPDRIYAHESGEGLVSFRWDGTDKRAHVQVTGRRAPGATEAPRASLLLVSPSGDRAMAQVGNDLYVVTIPLVGGETPAISVADPDQAAFPARKLTDVGGQFPAWGPDAETVTWSMGNAHFAYNLSAARAFEDSVESAEDESDDDATYQAAEVRVDVAVIRDIPQGVAVLRGATVLTMRNDEIIRDADIVIRNNRIESVGPRGAVPNGAEVIDVTGTTIVPGFVDTHAHLRASADIHRGGEVWSYAANLAYGVTTTRDPQTATTDVLTYEDLARAGTILAPRMYSTGPGVFSGEGIRDRDHAYDVLRRYSEYYDTKTIKMYVAGNREQRQWIIDAARELELMPTTEGALQAALDMTMAIDGYPGQEHNTPGFPFFEDVVKLYVASGTAYTPTILVTYGGPWAENHFYATDNPFDDQKLRRFTPFEELQSKTLRRTAGWFHPRVHTMDKVAKLVTDIVEAGGMAGVGSHGQLQGLGYHWELWAVQAGGLSEHDALRVATSIGARALGLDGDVGTIESGKLADLVILNHDPLADIRNTNTIRLVMKNGRLYDGNTLDEVWPRRRAAGPFYWQTEERFATENGGR